MPSCDDGSAAAARSFESNVPVASKPLISGICTAINPVERLAAQVSTRMPVEGDRDVAAMFFEHAGARRAVDRMSSRQNPNAASSSGRSFWGVSSALP